MLVVAFLRRLLRCCVSLVINYLCIPLDTSSDMSIITWPLCQGTTSVVTIHSDSETGRIWAGSMGRWPSAVPLSTRKVILVLRLVATMVVLCRYRYNGDFLISRAYITTYAGGSDREQFAPNQDQEIEYETSAHPPQSIRSCAVKWL